MPNVGSIRAAGLLPNSLISTSGGRSAKTLYLTFDDGPHPIVSERVCDLLASHGVTASFFCIGENLRKYPLTAKRIINDGHSLHNHSDCHRSYLSLTIQEQVADLTACQTEIQSLNPMAKPVFRAPRGELSLRSLLMMKRKGWDVVHWSYDSFDYQGLAIEEQLRRFDDLPVRNGDIVLFHDDSDRCIDTLQVMIPRWQSQGFGFATVDALLSQAGPDKP